MEITVRLIREIHTGRVNTVNSQHGQVSLPSLPSCPANPRRTPERRLRGHASFALPHTDSSAATSGVHIATPTIPRHLADARIQSSELAQLDLDPSFVVPASVTVVHPQLRDLISCPRERGVVYHVKGSSIVQLTVDVRSEEREDEDGKSRQATGREWWCPSVSRGHTFLQRGTHALAVSINRGRSRPWASSRTA
jgi:hypothetical protein